MLIAIWDTVNNGYNISKGGEGNPGRKLSDDVKEKISRNRKGKTCGSDNPMYGKKHTEDSLKKMSINRKGKLAGAEHPNSKRVVQYDRNGNFICIWDCINKASNELNICASNIANNCRGIQQTAGGFIWRYEDDPCELKRNHNFIEVYQFSLNGDLIRKWDRIADARKALNISTSRISACCRNRCKTAGGFIWRYENSCDCFA